MTAHKFDLMSQEFKQYPFPIFSQMRHTAPLVRSRLPMVGDVWLATTYESVNDVLHDQQNFALEARNAGKRQSVGIQWWMPRTFRILTKNMLTMDEPDHRRLRGLVEQAFLRQSVEGMRARITQLADQMLDQAEQRATANGGIVDLMEHFARPFPLAVICELLGLPEEDCPNFRKWADQLTSATSVTGMLGALWGIRKLLNYLKHQFQLCRQQPRPGLISALVEAEHEGKRLSEDELLAMAFLLLFAGHETTVHLISGGILALLQHPEQKTRLMSDWSQVSTAVDETLRYVSPIQITKPRYARHDLEFYGQKLKQGEVVMALLASANCDPAKFDDPERFDIHRTPNQHVEFGSGIHVCLGLKLARAEAATAYERLFTRYPNLELTSEQWQPQYISRIGIRALKSLPVQLNHSSAISKSMSLAENHT